MSAERPATGLARIGVLGGTFDPIHIGHLLLAEETRRALALDRLIFIPAGQPWRKAERRITPAADRVAMVELAVCDNPAFSVSRIEIDRHGPTYTVETLAALRRESGAGAGLWFLLGSDALLDLPNWRDPKGILALARLAVAAREPLDGAVVERLEQRLPGLGARMDRVPMPRVEISSSELRRRLRAGETVRYWLPDSVAAYARGHALYDGVALGGERDGAGVGSLR